MKKPLPLFFFAVLALSFNGFSQLRVALVAGPHAASVNEENNLPGWDTLQNKYSSRAGFHFGFMADLQLSEQSKFWFQPGIIYYNKGRKFSSTYDTSQVDYLQVDASQFLNYIDVPMNIVFKLPLGKNSKFFLGTGPYVSFFYNGREKTETLLKQGGVNTDENSNLPVGNGMNRYKTLDYGVNGTAGFEFSKIFLSFNFSRSIGDFYTASYDGHFKHQVMGGSLGIFLGKPVAIASPKDRDKDGILDNDDQCPDEPGTAATQGCPDSDADGVADKDDKCPGIKGLVKYNGCPVPDTDGDGINDEEDKCPDVKGLVKYLGCPVPDSDGDGVDDEKDKCLTVPGTKANNGCPEIRKEIVEKVNIAARNVQYEKNSATLTKESKKVLDEIAALLDQNKELMLDIEGHTSSEGSAEVNNRLSEERAMEVKNYLESKGVDASRLSAKGYGSTRLLNGENTPEERALNRRVELKLRNN